MAFVNKTMLHIDHSELHSLQQETSWEALPEEARTLSVAAAFSLLRLLPAAWSSRGVSGASYFSPNISGLHAFPTSFHLMYFHFSLRIFFTYRLVLEI